MSEASVELVAHVDAFVDSHRGAVRRLLDELVAQNSITWSKEGVDAVGDMTVAAMPAGFQHSVIPQTTYGDHHVLRRAGRHGALRVALAGHLDTLCPPDSAFNRVVQRSDRLNGPGVMDMKGGNVVMIWALRTLDAVGRLDDLDVTVILNSDEELGSPTSNGIFRSMAGKVDLALVFEASNPEGSVVTTRRGVSRHRAHFTGVEHHFGMLKSPKVSALEEAARKLLELELLNQADGSIAVNVGRLEGGLAANKVAHRAVLEYEVRAWRQAELDDAAASIARQVVRPRMSGCTIEVERLSYRPPMQLNPAQRNWVNLMFETARDLGQPLIEERRGGVSDACWLSFVGIPTLDGCGPRGDCDFTRDEYCFTESIYERIRLIACYLVRAARCHRETTRQPGGIT